MLVVHPPDDRRRIDERVDLEMHSQAQQHAGQDHFPPRDGPQQRHHHDAQQALRAAPRADGGHHRVQQPDTRKPQSPLEAHLLLGGGARAQHEHHQRAGHDIAHGEQDLAEGKPPPRAGPGGGQQQPGEQRRVAVRLAGVGRLAVGDEARGVGEDVVVNVGVLERRVRVLHEAVEEERDAEGDGSREDAQGAGEEPGH